MSYILNENSIIKLDVSGGTGLGPISSGTISVTGAWVGSGSITVTYDPKTKIMDGKVPITTIVITVTGSFPGFSPTTPAVITMNANSVYIKLGNMGVFLDTITGNATGTCTNLSPPYNVSTFTAAASIQSAIQNKVEEV